MTRQLLLARHAGAVALIALASATHAQEGAAGNPERPRAPVSAPLPLAPDDVRALPEAPAGFADVRPGIAHGRVEEFSYDSGVTGTRRKAAVYLPAGYSADRRYPVLYLLHGIAGNHDEWRGYVRASTIVDNLLADGRAQPMIIVMPNGRALPDDRPPPADRTFTPEHVAGFAHFERDLLDFLLPAVEAKYSSFGDRQHRAIAGLSMGGGQALNFGLRHLEHFAWVGGFSAAPNTLPAAELVPDPGATRRQLALLYLSCGSQDGLFGVSQTLHRALKQQGVPHVWNVDGHGHDRESWADNLYQFAQLIFR
ncbi:alpha/beta hydrolase [Ideonella sp. YS5]|uniref:alpha/beta hydrolase n=1 Tax=Ideonella sp. YS5 TaxID=3453714 RepID=UPI003EEF57C5